MNQHIVNVPDGYVVGSVTFNPAPSERHLEPAGELLYRALSVREKVVRAVDAALEAYDGYQMGTTCAMGHCREIRTFLADRKPSASDKARAAARKAAGV